MITVQQVYDMAIHLMDEQNESTGATSTVDTQEYKYRTISILNTAILRLFPYSGDYGEGYLERGRPTVDLLEAEDYKNPDFEQDIPLDDTLCAAILPFWLAAQLLSGENESLAAWFMARYQEAFADLRSKAPAEFQPISQPYGAF